MDVALACRARCAEPLVPGKPGQSHVLLCWIPSRDQQRAPPSFKRFWIQTTPRRWRDHRPDGLLIALFSLYSSNTQMTRGERVPFGARGCIFLSPARAERSNWRVLKFLIFSTCALLSREIKNRFEAVCTDQTCEINCMINWLDERLSRSLLLLHSRSILYRVQVALKCWYNINNNYYCYVTQHFKIQNKLKKNHNES